MTAPSPNPNPPTGESGADRNAPPPFSFKAYLRQSALQLAVVFVLYTLSIGPMYWRWYDAKYLNGPEYIARLYEPLYKLSAIKPFGEFLNWYVDLWIS